MKIYEIVSGDVAPQSVGVLFGRWNPPHKGHKAAWEMAASENPHWYVGTNRSTSGKKDPLPFDVKKKAMELLMPGIRKHIVPEQSWLTLISKIYEKHGDVTLNVYTDEKWVLDAITKYNGVEGKQHGFYNFSNIQSRPTPRLSSATAVRAAVAADSEEDFEKASGIPADTPLGDSTFFDVVKKYLTKYL